MHRRLHAVSLTLDAAKIRVEQNNQRAEQKELVARRRFCIFKEEM